MESTEFTADFNLGIFRSVQTIVEREITLAGTMYAPACLWEILYLYVLFLLLLAVPTKVKGLAPGRALLYHV